jgi:hypothetical protein
LLKILCLFGQVVFGVWIQVKICAIIVM